jgi:hypothetical protein
MKDLMGWTCSMFGIAKYIQNLLENMKRRNQLED